MYKYAGVPGMVSLAGGIPSPAYFPFETLSATILPYDHLPLDNPRVPAKPKTSLLGWLFGSGSGSSSAAPSIVIPKYAKDPTDPYAIQLATSLQYQMATGPPAFPKFLREYVQTVYKPGYADWDVLLDDGATDGFNKVCNLLLEVGDTVLVEEWTYPGAANAYLPYDTTIVGLKMDGQGIIPEELESLLANWDESKGRFPRLIYTVPTGQNPTGATMLGERKQAIYNIAVKYDLIIVEDEPYFTLYSGAYTPREAKLSPVAQYQRDLEKKEGKEGNEAFINALPPTYLRYDTDGRVIRLDTFSKTSAPGSRLGWITSSPLFIERLTRISESSTQAPSGFATSLTITLLNTWGLDGYIRWLRGLKGAYTVRRDWLIDSLADVFHLEFEQENDHNPNVLTVAGIGRGATAYARQPAGSSQALWDEKRGTSSPYGKPLVSFVPPTAGMFVWLAVHLDQHPEYHSLGSDATNELLRRLWLQLADHLVLFAPGFVFAPDQAPEDNTGVGYFRLSYSIITYEESRTAIKTFEEILVKFLHGRG
ncbi:hypothetical protein VHUM_03551 [Vanrija humicola]|uniref:Aminotransferase class I/classII large domain-containing protein n=1 Tax=Vanrija humicola TaxID=5417 RepID=A0A7D8UX50_VANHU|nr:hypothetical protein VHUM_03551 [Vanrija humicola]